MLLIDKISPRFQGYQKDDIVLAKSPMKLNTLLCKRIIAVENETITIDGIDYFIPPGHVWIEGDNKSQSFDSRNYGPISTALLDGKVLFKIWNTFTKY